MRRLRLSLVLLALSATSAAADPSGRYLVTGLNPGMPDRPYQGYVEVGIEDELYAVTWWIGDKVYEGTAIGARVVDGELLPGPAHPNDTALVIGYPAGVVVMVLQADGTMAGRWALGGEAGLGTETWTPSR